MEYLQSYIDLQEQRFGKNLSLSVSMNKDSNYQIAPMLLIPFVENAFKHGVGMVTDAIIDITLDAKNSKLLKERSFRSLKTNTLTEYMAKIHGKCMAKIHFKT